jgi:hypothetical protein
MTMRNFALDRPTRRGWLQAAAGGMAGAGLAGWFGSLASAMSDPGRPKRSCILLWMNGGPSQTDTFDLKPGHEHGGPFRPIASRVPGIEVCEHLPGIAQWTDQLAIIRSMSTKEGDHGRARDNLRTGYFPQASIQFPVLGSLVSKEFVGQAGDLPNYVSIFPRGLFNAGMPPAGFLGPDYAPLLVGQDNDGNENGQRLAVENLALPKSVSIEQALARIELLQRMERKFLDDRPGAAAESHRTTYAKAARMMSPEAAKAFQLDDEPSKNREPYGNTQFGQGCLLARRLVERGVPFVEVSLGGWDTHDDNFRQVQNLCGVLDKAWSALMRDLKERGLLDSTLIVWMGEFGRTPAINPRQGRDHYPKAWSVVLGGGLIRGGQVVGRTSGDGMAVEDRPVSTPDVLATICVALGLDPNKQHISNVGRPIRLVDPSAEPVLEVIAKT